MLIIISYNWFKAKTWYHQIGGRRDNKLVISPPLLRGKKVFPVVELGKLFFFLNNSHTPPPFPLTKYNLGIKVKVNFQLGLAPNKSFLQRKRVSNSWFLFFWQSFSSLQSIHITLCMFTPLLCCNGG